MQIQSNDFCPSEAREIVRKRLHEVKKTALYQAKQNGYDIEILFDESVPKKLMIDWSLYK